MEKAGSITSIILEEIKEIIKPGISTQDIDNFCQERLLFYNAISGSLGYNGFPKYLCTSVNNIVCHGVPNSETILHNGDIISVDLVLQHDGYFGDSCITYAVGEITYNLSRLINVCYQAMWDTIELIRPGLHIGDLGYSMMSIAKSNGYDVIRDFCGHTIDNIMHKEPNIPFLGYQGQGPKLKTDMFITIEPMLVTKSPSIRILSDGWSAKTRDNGYASQFEHTVHVTQTGYNVLTYNYLDTLNNKPKTK